MTNTPCPHCHHTPLTTEARAIIAGLLAPTDDIDPTAIYASPTTWDELAHTFPTTTFWTWATQHRTTTDIGYHPNPDH